MIRSIRERYFDKPQWSYYGKDLVALEKAIRGDEAAPGEGGAPGGGSGGDSDVIAYSSSTTSAMDEITKLMAAQAARAGGMEIKLDAINLTSKEAPEEPAPNGTQATPEAAKP